MAPLTGVRVVEMEAIGPLLHAGMLLADLGADVVRVVRPSRDDAPDGADAATDAMRRGRRVVTADLRDPADRDRVLDLVAGADVVLEGFRPGTMERLGLGPDDCRDRNRRLVYGRMTGWGQEGPLASSAGHDINYLAVAGALEPMGPADAPPLPPLNYVGNFGGGSMVLVLGVVSALLERERTGSGQVVDAAMVDGAGSLTSLLRSWSHAGRWSDERGTNVLDGSAPFYRSYACADGRFVAVGALEPVFYDAFVRGLGLDPDGYGAQWDRESWPALTAAITGRMATRSRDEWVAAFAGVDACLTPVLTLEEAPRHEQARARGAFTEVGGVTLPSPAPRFSAHDLAAAPPARAVALDDAVSTWAGREVGV